MKFILREWQDSDLPSLVKHANNPNIAKFMTDRFAYPYTEENGKAFIEMAKNKPKHLFAIEINNEAVGGIGIHLLEDIMQKNAELGYWLSEDYWGKGIITEAIRQIIPIAFKENGIRRLFARPFGTNKASQRVLEKAGFKFECKFEKTIFKNGEYIDELFYSVIK
ncbi:MAG: GNAT family N-acetyltransferase [Bacteroidia bacterium]